MPDRQLNQNIQKAILKTICKLDAGMIFTPSSFLGIATRKTVDVTLHRLVQDGKVRRIGRGLYQRPKLHPRLGPLSPSADDIARAVADRDGIRLLPSGAYAANLLRLSEQVPSRYEYLTDGRTKSIKVDRLTIEFKRAEAALFRKSAKTSALVISALKYLGKQHISYDRVKHLRELLPSDERKRLMKNIELAPGWMHPFIRYISNGQGEPTIEHVRTSES